MDVTQPHTVFTLYSNSSVIISTVEAVVCCAVELHYIILTGVASGLLIQGEGRRRD